MRRVIITLLLALLGLAPLAGAVMFLKSAAAPPQFFFEGPDRFDGGAPGTMIPHKEVGFRYPAGKSAE